MNRPGNSGWSPRLRRCALATGLVALLILVVAVPPAAAQEKKAEPPPKEVFDALTALDVRLIAQMGVVVPEGKPPTDEVAAGQEQTQDAFDALLKKHFPSIHGLDFAAFFNKVRFIDRRLEDAAAAQAEKQLQREALDEAADNTDKLRKELKKGGAPKEVTDELIGLESEIRDIAKGGKLGTDEAKAEIRKAAKLKLKILTYSFPKVFGFAQGSLYEKLKALRDALGRLIYEKGVTAAGKAKAALVDFLNKKLPGCGGGGGAKEAPPKKKGKRFCVLRARAWRSLAAPACSRANRRFAAVAAPRSDAELLSYMRAAARITRAEAGALDKIEPTSPRRLRRYARRVVFRAEDIASAYALGVNAIQRGFRPSGVYARVSARVLQAQRLRRGPLRKLGLRGRCGKPRLRRAPPSAFPSPVPPPGSSPLASEDFFGTWSNAGGSHYICVYLLGPAGQAGDVTLQGNPPNQPPPGLVSPNPVAFTLDAGGRAVVTFTAEYAPAYTYNFAIRRRQADGSFKAGGNGSVSPSGNPGDKGPPPPAGYSQSGCGP